MEHASEGYVSIKSVYSNKYIGVDSTATTVIRQYSTQNDYTLWKFERTTSGNLKLVCKALGTTTVMALPSDDAKDKNGTNLTTVTYAANDVYNDEWQIFEDISFGGLAIDIDDTATPNIITDCPKNLNKVTDYNYTITSNDGYISLNNTTGVITAIKSGTATVKATHKVIGVEYTFNVKVNKNAIIIVPGIFGSELFAGEGTPYFKDGAGIISTEVINVITHMANNFGELWDESTWQEQAGILTMLVLNPVTVLAASAYADAVYTVLDCNDNGTSKYNVYTKKYKPELGNNDDPDVYTTNCGTLDSYGNLYRALADSPEISTKYNIEFFSYDWRLSNGYSAEKLDEFIEEAGYDKVILVAHSMGGLVASGYLALGEEQRNKTIDVYMLASPLLGTPEVINVWANLDFSFLGLDSLNSWIPAFNIFLSFATLNDNAMRQLLSNYQSVYELLPTEKYLDVALRSYLVHTITHTLDFSDDQVNYCNYTSSKSIFSEKLPYFDNTLMGYAELFHNSCYCSNIHVSRFVDTYYIYSQSEDTLTQVEFYEEYVLGILSDSGFRKKVTESDGDSLVPYWSATIGLPTNLSKVKMIEGTHMTPIKSQNSFNYIIENILSN